MTVFAATKFDGIFYTEYTVCSGDHTGVTFLSTHGSVERCLFYKDGSFLTFHQGIHDLCLCGQNSYFGGSFQFVISVKFGCDIAVDLIVYSCICAHIVADCTAFSCTFSLHFHLFFEAVLINSVSFFFQNLFRQIDWESIRIIQTEGIGASKDGLSCFFHLSFQIGENLKSLVNGLVELTFFVMQNVQDKGFLFFQFRISIFGSFDDSLTQFLQERSFDTKKTSVTGCTTDQTAKNIASSFIGRHNPIRDQEGSGTHMIRDQTDGYIVLVIDTISFSGNFTDLISQGTQCIYIKNRIYILNNNSQTFQPHTGINIFLFQSLIMTFPVIFELGKYVIPYFHITVAVTSYGTARFTTAVFFSTVIVNLRTRTARTCAVLPEVVFFSETEDSVSRNTNFFIPDIEGFIILFVYRRIQTILIQTYHFCQKFPGPCDGFVFEVITKREVTKHLEESTVTGCLSYVLDITGTDTFLAGSHTSSRRNLCSGKIRF